MRTLLLSVLLLVLPGAAAAQEVPELLTRGFAAYETDGHSAALDAWLQGWGADDARPIREAFIPMLREMEEKAGPYVGGEFLGTVQWGEHARRVYALVMYEKRPLFARFDVYRVSGEWRLLNLTVNTAAEQVFPPAMLIPPGSVARAGG